MSLQTQQWDTDSVVTVPNLVSFIRLLGVPAFCWLIVQSHDLAAVALLALFGATDWVDGYLARKLSQRSALGAKLDPIADRLYILVAVFALLVRGIVPIGFVVVLFARDVMLLLLVPLLRRHGLVALPVTMVGKAATMLLLFALPLILLGASASFGWVWAHWLGWMLGVLGAILYWTAGLGYLAEVIKMSRQRP